MKSNISTISAAQPATKKTNHDERVEARDLIMAKKPNTGKHECVEARDLIIAKRPRRR